MNCGRRIVAQQIAFYRDQVGHSIAIPPELRNQGPFCRRCRNHSQITPWKGHKKVCPWGACLCLRCQLIVQRKTNEKRLRDEIQKAKEEVLQTKDGSRAVTLLPGNSATNSVISSTEKVSVHERERIHQGENNNPRKLTHTPNNSGAQQVKHNSNALSVTEITRQAPPLNIFSQTSVNFPMPTLPIELKPTGFGSHQERDVYQNQNQHLFPNNYSNPTWNNWNNFQFRTGMMNVPAMNCNSQISPGTIILL